MTEHKVPIQSLIDHIKTAVDIDPWAKEMAEELLKEQPEIVRCKDCKKHDTYDCNITYLTTQKTPNDWFCADGRKKDDNG